jgi:hypothetical protein
MSADEFVADQTQDELDREILLLERHIRQSTGRVPQGVSSKPKKGARPDPKRVVLNDKLTQLGSSGRRTTWG